MLWVIASVVVALAGLLVLAACGLYVFAALRRFGQEVERARARLAPRQDALRRELARLPRSEG